MLEQVYTITQGTDPKNYVRGFILSMVESVEDIQNGIKLVQDIFKSYALPVVPLFENQQALTHANTILIHSISADIRKSTASPNKSTIFLPDNNLTNNYYAVKYI